MTRYLIFSLLSYVCTLPTSYAYCVLNKTIGNDSYYQKPTVIAGYTTSFFGWGEFINQGEFACNHNVRQGGSDQSEIGVSWVNKNGHQENICVNKVYNVGGYIIVSGNAATGFTCEVRRGTH
jgi:hypothetical protein